MRHTLLAGAEFGRQLTDNFRNTGFFNNTATSILVPFADPTITTPVTFRQSATDADNHLTTNVAAAYAQDQIELSRHVQVLGGLRFDRFDLDVPQQSQRRRRSTAPTIWSRRAPASSSSRSTPVSLYGSYSVSYLPSSGDQFSSLTDDHRAGRSRRSSTTTRSARSGTSRPSLSLTTARLPPGPHQHALDRSQRSDADRADRQPAHQRLRARRQRTASRRRGASPAATPIRTRSSPARPTAARGGRAGRRRCRTTRSRCGTTTRCTRASAPASASSTARDMFAAIDNTVTLPGYTRVDAAGVLHADASSCACRRTSRTCSTRRTSSTPTATRTSRRDFRARCGSA